MNAKRVVACFLILGLVAAGVGFSWPLWSWQERLHFPGIVEIQEVRLASKVGGRVESVEVMEGDFVEPGQLLVRFEAPEVRAQLDQARARAQMAEDELAKARSGPRLEEKLAALAAVDAARARLERLQAGWREEEVRRSRSELHAAEADLKLATEELDRAEKLARGGMGSISKSDLDTARFSRDRAFNQHAAAKARFEMLDRGNRKEDIAEAAADLKRAEANWKLLDLGTRKEDVAIAEANVLATRARVAEVEANLREAEVRAPEKALIEVLAVRKGDVVPPNQPAVRVLRAQDMWVKVYVPETLLGKVHVGQSVSVTVDSYPERKFAGKVIHIASESEFTPRNVQSVDERRHQVFGVKVHIADPQNVFKAGMAAEVTFE